MSQRPHDLGIRVSDGAGNDVRGGRAFPEQGGERLLPGAGRIVEGFAVAEKEHSGAAHGETVGRQLAAVTVDGGP